MEELSLEYLQKELPQRFRTKRVQRCKECAAAVRRVLSAATDACKRILQRRKPEKEKLYEEAGKSDSFEDYYA